MLGGIDCVTVGGRVEVGAAVGGVPVDVGTPVTGMVAVGGAVAVGVTPEGGVVGVTGVAVGTAVVGIGTAPTQLPPPGQSSSSTQAKLSKSPPRQNNPVDRQSEPGQCAFVTQGNPLFSPARQSFCVLAHGEPSKQLMLTSQQRSTKTPPRQVPNEGSLGHCGSATHSELGQAQKNPSDSPPLQTPRGITQTPLSGQSTSPAQS